MSEPGASCTILHTFEIYCLQLYHCGSDKTSSYSDPLPDDNSEYHCGSDKTSSYSDPLPADNSERMWLQVILSSNPVCHQNSTYVCLAD